MEHAPLRPVPSRAAGPIDPVAAARELAAALPYLSEVEARALALVAMAAMPRADAVEALGVDERTLSDALATGRKELRRTVATLPGSGWCERAERLISDRLDGPPGANGSPRPDAPPRGGADHRRPAPAAARPRRAAARGGPARRRRARGAGVGRDASHRGPAGGGAARRGAGRGAARGGAPGGG